MGEYAGPAPRAFWHRSSRNAARPMLECAVTGLLAWRGGQPGQVGNEAATAVFRQCRGSGSSPSSFSSVFSPATTPRTLTDARRDASLGRSFVACLWR